MCRLTCAPVSPETAGTFEASANVRLTQACASRPAIMGGIAK